MTDWGFHSSVGSVVRDDHPQYARVDGSRSFTGPVNVPSLTATGAVTAASFVATGGTPIGGLVTSFSGPGSPVSATNTSATVTTFNATLVGGQQYHLFAYAVISVTAGVPAFTNVRMTDSSSLLPGSMFVVSQNAPPLASTIPGMIALVLSPGSNVTDTFTFTLADSGAATTSQVPANGVLASITRVS